MKIDKYEIDMLEVGKADALLIHFHNADDNTWHVIMVDAGNPTDGEKITKFVKKVYNTNVVDLAICTHNNMDHFGGFISILKNQIEKVDGSLIIKEMWINYCDNCSYINNGDDLLHYTYLLLMSDPHFQLHFGYSNLQSESYKDVIEILEPTKEYFESLFSHKINEDQKEYSDLNQTHDPSVPNASSIIFLFQPNNKDKYLFTGDASEDSFKQIIDRGQKEKITDIYWLKVPHHGSEGNLSTDLLKIMKPKVAYISTAKDDANLQGTTVRELQKYGKVYSGCMRHRHNMPDREGYSTADPIPDVK